MGRYLKATEQPYVSLFSPDNIEFIDNKLMQSQQRYDTANAMYNQYVQSQLDKGYLDTNARKKYETDLKNRFDNVIKKHGYNLAEASNEISNTVTQDKTDPYHILNDFQLQQAAIEQQETARLGANAINLNPVGIQSLLDDKGNYRTDLDNLKANVVEASDYAKVAVNLGAMLKNNSFSESLRRANFGYLVGKDISELTQKDIKDLSTMPEVQQAFLANAPTALYDNRAAVGYDPKTNTNIFSTSEGISNYIQGNLLSAVNRQEKNNYLYDQKSEFDQKMAFEREKENNRRKVEEEEKKGRQPYVDVKESPYLKEMDSKQKNMIEGASEFIKMKKEGFKPSNFQKFVNFGSPFTLAHDYLVVLNDRKEQYDNFYKQNQPTIDHIMKQGNMSQDDAIETLGIAYDRNQTRPEYDFMVIDQPLTETLAANMFASTSGSSFNDASGNSKDKETISEGMAKGKYGSFDITAKGNFRLNAKDGENITIPKERLSETPKNTLDLYATVVENERDLSGKDFNLILQDDGKLYNYELNPIDVGYNEQTKKKEIVNIRTYDRFEVDNEGNQIGERVKVGSPHVHKVMVNKFINSVSGANTK